LDSKLASFGRFIAVSFETGETAASNQRWAISVLPLRRLT